ncbi:MAG: 4Fe-4S binding protein [Candidatus Muirbacterium halophilum]|nr:4Fe-4S binding protein [Candidatus Muirbacterium halophilum]
MVRKKSIFRGDYSMDYKKTGIIDINKVVLPQNWEELTRFFPVIECIEKIPCNPCSWCCPKEAITIQGDITNLPEIDFDKCTGCAICAGKCPGLAIFLVNPNFDEQYSAIIMPYEFRPLPVENQKVTLIDRHGNERGNGEVVKIRLSSAFEKTPLVTVKVPKELIMEIRHIRAIKKSGKSGFRDSGKTWEEQLAQQVAN